MSRAFVASILAILAGTVPAAAQIAREEVPATSRIDRRLVGMPIVTVDGATIGYITEVGIDDGQAIVIAEIVRHLGSASPLLPYRPRCSPTRVIMWSS